MRKLLLLFSLCMLLGIGNMRAEVDGVSWEGATSSDTQGWEFSPALNSSWSSKWGSYMSNYNGLYFKTQTYNMTSPTFTNLTYLAIRETYTKSLMPTGMAVYYQVEGTEAWINFKDGLENSVATFDLPAISRDGDYNDIEIPVPDEIKNKSVRIRIGNGSNCSFMKGLFVQAVLYEMGGAIVELPELKAPAIAVRNKTITITNPNTDPAGQVWYSIDGVDVNNDTPDHCTTLYTEPIAFSSITPGTYVVKACVKPAEGEQAITSPVAGSNEFTVVAETLEPANLRFMLGETVVTEATVDYPQATYDLPKLVKDSNAAATFTSSNTAVISFNATGNATVNGPGVATVTATTPANGQYEAGTASYTLTVQEKAVVKQAAEIKWMQADADVTGQVVTTAYGAQFVAPKVAKATNAPVIYASSNTDVVSVNATGAMTIGKPGTATITASAEENEFFYAGNATVTVTVEKGTITYKWMVNGQAATEATVYFGESNYDVKVDYPEGFAPSFTTSNRDVAEIQVLFGKPQLIAWGTGTCVLTASFAGNDYYNPTTAELNLTVAKRKLPAPTIAIADGKITITRSGEFGTLYYYNGPKGTTENPIEAADYSMTNDASVTLDCLEGKNNVFAFTVSNNAGFDTSDLATATYEGQAATIKQQVGYKWTVGGQQVSELTVNYGETLTVTFENPNKLRPTSITSSDSQVVNVVWSATAGAPMLTVNYPGTAVITATYDADDTYEACTATLTVTVKAIPLAAPTVAINDGKITITRTGDVGTVYYYNGPKNQIEDVTETEWTAATSAETILACIDDESINYVYAYTEGPNAGYLRSTIIDQSYSYSGVEGIELDPTDVRVVNGTIIAPEGAEVYSVSGIRVAPEGLRAGIYVVRLGNSAVKVMVK